MNFILLEMDLFTANLQKGKALQSTQSQVMQCWE